MSTVGDAILGLVVLAIAVFSVIALGRLVLWLTGWLRYQWHGARLCFTCPYCWRRLRLATCPVVSQLDGKVIHHPLSRLHLMPGLLLQTITGPAMTRLAAIRQCPHCTNQLPRNLDHGVEPIVIGLIGGTTSGKGTYLTALTYALEVEGKLSACGCGSVMPQVDTGRRAQEMRRHLFEERQPEPTTIGTLTGQLDRPLIYELQFKSAGRPRVYNLMLFEAAGSDLQDQNRIAEHHPYVLHASGLIFLLDPRTMPEVVSKLRKEDRPLPGDSSVKYNNRDIVKQVYSLYHQYRGMKLGEEVDIPLAVTISKGDLLAYAANRLGLTFDPMADHNRGGCFDEGRVTQESEELWALLQNVCGPPLIDAIKQFGERVRYNVVSATGNSLQNGTYPEVRPVRCMDPLVALLAWLQIVCPQGVATP